MIPPLTVPEVRPGGKIARFVTHGDWTADLGMGLQGTHELFSGDGMVARLVDDQLCVFAGFAFDGCSPAFRIPGTSRWVGTYTPPGALAACLTHDVLRLFLGLSCLRYDRKFTDDVFFNMLRRSGFQLDGLYHAAVAGPPGDFWLWITSRRARPNLTCRSCR